MTSRRLVQTRGFLRIEAELEADVVRYHSRAFLSSHEINVPLLLIPTQTTRFFRVNRWHLLICALLGFGTLYRVVDFLRGGDASPERWLFSLFWFAIAVAGTWINSARYVGYATPAGGLFFFDTRGTNDPSTFLRAIAEARDAGRSETQTPRPIGFRTSVDESAA
jgi:hypothetical protein